MPLRDKIFGVSLYQFAAFQWYQMSWVGISSLKKKLIYRKSPKPERARTLNQVIRVLPTPARPALTEKK
jgi:hypothetical protein